MPWLSAPGQVRLNLAAALAAILLAAGCGAGSDPPAATPTIDRPAPSTPPAGQSKTPEPDVAFAAAALEAPPRPPDEPLPEDEVDGPCPYIRAGLNIEPGGDVTFANLEGNRVQRVTALTALTPVGCRFYFPGDYHPIGDILPSSYANEVDAYNAMVLTARAGSSVQSVPGFAPGVDGVSFQTRLSAPDAGRNWAFAFAKGNVMVVVRTDQTDSSLNAVNIAEAIVDRF